MPIDGTNQHNDDARFIAQQMPNNSPLCVRDEMDRADFYIIIYRKEEPTKGNKQGGKM